VVSFLYLILLTYLSTLRDARFLSLKATNIIARRESLGWSSERIPTLKATNNFAPTVARLQRAGELPLLNPAILAGL